MASPALSCTHVVATQSSCHCSIPAVDAGRVSRRGVASPAATATSSISLESSFRRHSASLSTSKQDIFAGAFDRRAIFSPQDGEVASSSARQQRGGCGAVSMNYSSHFDNLAFERDEYIEAHVIEAVRMVPSKEHLYMTMADGSEVEVEHVNPSAGRLLYLNSMPTIFLRMVDSTNLLLPIVVGDLAIGFLMKAFKRDPHARPNYYELMKDLTESLQSEIKHVKITQRVGDTYYARIYLTKPGSSSLVSVDARPSDAVNLAVRAGVPIFVAKAIVHNDAVRVVYDPAKHGPAQPRKIVLEMDRGISGPDDALEEIILIKSMKEAAADERYDEAARLRDELNALRSKSKSGRTQLNKF